MRRKDYEKLLDWKNQKNKKPLLLQGARQVGKTYLVDEFGENEYENYFYFNFEKDEKLRDFFQGNLNPAEIIENLSLYISKDITKKNSLIFFDEIQVESKILTSLKYFYEEMPEFDIIAAGSLLGVSIGKGCSFPVGKVNFMTLTPMSFYEFLLAIDEKLIAEKLQSKKNLESINEAIHNKLIKLLTDYLYIGGMPEVVQNYVDNKQILKCRKVQLDILKSYNRDFSKYATHAESLKNLSVWNSIPYQLAKENKKFVCSEISKKTRLSTFETSLEWLKNAGLINIVTNIKVPKLPLSGYEERKKFKVYLLDTGLLGAMLEIEPASILESKLFSEYKGAFIENYIAMEFKNMEIDKLYYWTSKSDAEVDFIMKYGDNVLPIEVKSGLNRNLKSLRSYYDKYNPKHIVRISPRNFERNNEFINIPLYAPFLIKNI